MSLHKNVDFHAILLYRQNYREKDMLVKFFTAEFGTKMFMIKGGRRANFKLRADILPFTYGQYIGSISDDGLSYIKEPLQTHHYLKISDEITLNAYATYLMALIDVAMQEGHPDRHWFNQLYYALKLIDQGIDPAIITNIVEVQLLSLFGVAPDLTGCVICHRDDRPLDYSESYGGLLCQNHWHLDPRRMHLDRRTVYYLRWFTQINVKNLHQVNVNPVTEANLRHVLDKIYDDSVGLHLKSKHFLDQVTKL